jgi:hypothetical protein
VVTIILESSSPHYKQWLDLMLLMLCRYDLDDHVLFDVTDSSTYWARLDNIVATWILGTLSPELHEIIWELTENAREAWLVLEAQFLENYVSYFLQLDARFCIFKQGDISVSDYYRQMKDMDDDFHALGETITNRHLVLNLLYGMNKKFDHMKIFITQSQLFPSFHTTTNSNMRRSSWTTQWPRGKPLHSTPRPQEEGVLCSSSSHHTHLSKSR